MPSDKGVDKLKELEQSIAQELDQKISLSQPSDPRLDGTVQLNPSLDTKRPTEPSPFSKSDTVIVPQAATQGPTPPSGAPGNEKPINSDRKVEDITLEEVDALLSEVDETFGEKLTAIKSEVGQLDSLAAQNLESISISADYLKDDKEDSTVTAEATDAIDEKDSVELSEDVFETDEEAIKNIGESFWRYLRGLIASVVLFPVDLSWKSGKFVWKSRKNPPKQILQELWPALKPTVLARQTAFLDLFEYVRSYPAIHWVKLGGLVALAFGLRWVILDIRHNIHAPEVKDPFLKTFEEVAQDKKHVAEDVENNNAVPVPEFVVSLPRLVATLKTDTPRRHPMVAVELFIEGSDREAAVEISKRRNELRDQVARILEQMTFAELESMEGKDRLKLRIRLATNKLLNNGRAKQVFFKSIQIRE